MKLSAYQSSAGEEPKTEAYDNADGQSVFDDDDFWEAIDIMESARYQLMQAIKFTPSMHPGRRVSMEKVADELQQFIDLFIVAPTEPSTVSSLVVLFWECAYCRRHNPAEESVCRECGAAASGEAFEKTVNMAIDGSIIEGP